MSSPTPIQPTSQGSTSIWGHMLNVGKTVGNSVLWIGEKIGQGAAKIYELVKPFFQMIGTLFGGMFMAFKDFLKEHKSEAIVGVITFGLGVVAMSLFNAICCSNSRRDPQTA